MYTGCRVIEIGLRETTDIDMQHRGFGGEGPSTVVVIAGDQATAYATDGYWYWGKRPPLYGVHRTQT